MPGLTTGNFVAKRLFKVDQNRTKDPVKYRCKMV